MALRINLYHEIHRARKEQRYDPLKISLMCLGIVALGLAGWYVLKLSETNTVREQFATQQAEIAKLTPQSEKAKIDEADIKKELDLAAKLVSRIESRFYWAPVLESFTKTIPKNVQINRLGGDAGILEATGRRIGLTIDGVAAGEQPRKVAEDLRLALIEAIGEKYKSVTASFRSLEDSVEHVNLDGQDRPTAIFSIILTFNTAGSGTAVSPTTTAKQ
jgi:Tfp pilus assembly protein PilN